MKAVFLAALLWLAACDRQVPATADPAAVAALNATALPGAFPVGWARIELGGEPTILFYPGDLDGAAGLRFMGVLDAEHNYRPKIF